MRPMPGSIACWRWASVDRAVAFLRAHSGPAIAGWLGRSTGLGADRGSCCWVSFAWSRCSLWWPGFCGPGGLPLRSWLRFSSMPFWVDIFHDYYLPDLLHAAILAAILLCLLFGHVGSAMLLLFPAYLARESTVLVAICLVFACWRYPARCCYRGAGAAVRRPGQPALRSVRARQRTRVERRHLHPGQAVLEFLQECSRRATLE